MIINKDQGVQPRSKYLLWAVIFSMIWSVIILLPNLADPYRVVVDVQNHYWMAKFQSPTLFQGDKLQFGNRLIQISISDTVIPLYPISLGYGILLYIASFLIDPIWFVKFMVFFLMPISVAYVYKIGKFITGEENVALIVSIFFAVINMASPDSLSLASGLQKSFALPLLIIYSYYLIKKNYKIAALLIPVTALFYLPNALLMIVAFVLILVDCRIGNKTKNKFDIKSFWTFVLAIVLTMALASWALMLKYQLQNSNRILAISEPVPLSKNPIYQEGGPTPLYSIFPWVGRAGLFEVRAEMIIFLILIIMIFIIHFVVEKNLQIHVHPVFWKIFFAGFIMYGISILTMYGFSSLALYMPSRYSRIVLFYLPFWFVGLNFKLLVSFLPNWIRSNWRKIYWIVLFLLGLLALLLVIKMKEIFLWMVLVICGIIVILVFGYWVNSFKRILDKRPLKVSQLNIHLVIGLVCTIPIILYSRFIGFHTINPTSYERDIFNYVAKLPEDIFLAGSPDELNGIPLFSKRNVIFRELFPDGNAPIIDIFDAYYGEDADKILEFCRQFGVDYWVRDSRDFNENYITSGEFFYLPYNSQIAEYISGRSEFIMMKVDPEFESGPLSIIRCADIQ